MIKIAIITPLQIENASLGNTQRMMQIFNFFYKIPDKKIDIFCDDFSLRNEFFDQNILCNSYYRNISEIRRKNFFTHKIDDWICQRFFDNLKKKYESYSYDLVWCNYPFLSKYLDCFSAKRKIIDLHDNFLHRNEMMGETSWFSCNSKELYKAFSRADIAVSISSTEYELNKNIFHNINHTYLPFIPFNTTKKNKTIQKQNGKIKLGFIGSVNSVNIKAIQNLEKIAEKLPNITFVIGGSICEKITSNFSNIIKLGFLANTNDFYSEIDLTISPTFNSTGQKIKVIESILNGLPCLTSSDSKPDFISSYFANNINSLDEFIRILSKIDRTNITDIFLTQKEIVKKLTEKANFGFSEILQFYRQSKFKVHQEI